MLTKRVGPGERKENRPVLEAFDEERAFYSSGSVVAATFEIFVEGGYTWIPKGLRTLELEDAGDTGAVMYIKRAVLALPPLIRYRRKEPNKSRDPVSRPFVTNLLEPYCEMEPVW